MEQTILRNAAIPNYLKPMPFQKVSIYSYEVVRVATTTIVADNGDQIRFLGGKLGKALAEEYDVSTVSDLLYASSLCCCAA